MQTTKQTVPSEPLLTARDRLSVWAGLLLFVLAALAFWKMGALLAHRRSDELLYQIAEDRAGLLLLGGVAVVFLALPALRGLARRAGALQRSWVWAALASACVFLSVFLIHTGRHQFGGFDFSILMEVGWRQLLGQRQYVELMSPTPPGFGLGIKFAYQIFGATWDAGLYFSAVFTCVTFVWIYWLLRQQRVSAVAALATAFACECGSMLSLSFWWYNNTTLVLAAVFFLASVLLVKRPRSFTAGLSYFFALSLLATMKPNIAGALIAGVLVLLLVISQDRLLLLGLTVGTAVFVLCIFFWNHISIPAMLAAYREVSRERGGLSAFGFHQMVRTEKIMAVLWFAALTVPMLHRLPLAWREMRDTQWRRFAYSLLFPLALLVAFYGLMTNGELWEVECTLLLAADAVLVFGERTAGPLARRLFIALLCAGIAGNLYLGAERMRVYFIGPHTFFEWEDNEHRIESGALKNMRVSKTMYEVHEEIEAAKEQNPGPYFFGPRVDFEYAALGVTPLPGFPAWWHPGTAFGKEQQPQLVRLWQAAHFQTLIFLKDDYIFYPPEFMQAITTEYVRDDRYARITVWHRR
jgi:hypothetical protein